MATPDELWFRLNDANVLRLRAWNVRMDYWLDCDQKKVKRNKAIEKMNEQGYKAAKRVFDAALKAYDQQFNE